jgi:hypothetical protein
LIGSFEAELDQCVAGELRRWRNTTIKRTRRGFAVVLLAKNEARAKKNNGEQRSLTARMAVNR